jgi:hypothetical protein
LKTNLTEQWIMIGQANLSLGLNSIIAYNYPPFTSLFGVRFGLGIGYVVNGK